MKLKGRLITAFIVMIVMPIMLIAITASTIVRFQINSINQSYDVEANTIQVISNPIRILNRITRGVYNEIKLNALKSPERLEDEEYYEELDQELKNKYSFLAVRKKEDFIYIGSGVKLEMIEELLPKFGVSVDDVDGGIYLGGKDSFLVKAQDFYFSDGEEGTIFVITDLNILVPQLKAVAIQSVVSFLIIIIFTAFLLIYWIYRSILRPLNVLRLATNRIKDGDLDTAIVSDTEDEIGQLCEDFEQMRIRLKKLIEDRLQYEEEMKELVSNISHDLKTPLTAIKGYAEGLMDGVADTPQKQEKYLKTISMKANDMTVLVDELAFYSKIDCNTVPYTFKDINLKEYFDDCMEDLRLELEVKSIKIIYHNETDSLVRVVADAEQLKRVIHNIIGNSVKYLDKKEGIIKISIEDIGQYIQVNIQDNGSGIGKPDLPYIFDRFYRADSSRNSKKGGSGLGLAISKKVIEDHAGKIWATSEEGIGTTISFTLKKS
ncbi:HAMP domain-containing histidine kinase [Mobilitalea sibirica]|uniref:histidine kinase n=1 Tax=Mobilitalea sibirica TaxID=1462919 RepID=A0A8J7H421_9FIRM|nr:HAMP domain-containing sensor histidine kinase [Mobilitalea sibirica]MBH1941895.1 HAMP domain-containing histidine kinase [Mobilitalea sibirica]